MKLRGRRRCTSCDHQWSYFDTGSTACPACGDLRSVSVEDDPTLHTDGPTGFDLTPARRLIDRRPLGEVATTASSIARAYVRARGFVREGELLDLDGRVFAAAELAYAGDRIGRALELDEPTESYFYDLLAGAEDGTRPDVVPDGIRGARGLAAVDVVGTYRRDVGRWLDGHPVPDTRPALDHLRTHERRISALDGDVPSVEADAFVNAARDLSDYLRRGDDSALGRAEDRLSDLG